METVLDRGARQATALSSDPDTQMELYETLGLMYQHLGDFSKAEGLLRSGMELTKKLPPENQQAASALVQLGLLRGIKGTSGKRSDWSAKE